jgi:DNA-binding response OmpR family regulator
MIANILLVEDDKNIREFLSNALMESDFGVKSTGDGAKALNLIKEDNIDLVILDLGIENVSGETVCIEAKKINPSLPIIILTAKNRAEDVVKGLGLGADDYISKPFDYDELHARIKTRLKLNQSSIIEVEDLKLNKASLEVTRGDRKLDLTAKEIKLLEYLMLNRGIVLSRERILNHVWKYSLDVETRVVDVYIGYLRNKVDKGEEKKLIESVRGFGYVIK